MSQPVATTLNTGVAPNVTAIDNTLAGHWRIVAYPSGANGTTVSEDVTVFRGTPTTIGQFSFSDPFGPSSLGLTFPQISIFDTRGAGDLWWLGPDTLVDLIWNGDLPDSYPFGVPIVDTHHDQMIFAGWKPKFSWEGRLASIERSAEGCSLTFSGELLSLDDFLAKPEYIPRPFPYEFAITRQFRDRPSLNLKHPKVLWPSNWGKIYTPPAPKTPRYLVPAGVRKNQFWTEMLTRQTGSWDKVLTSYIQQMLTSMYTRTGRWTLDLGVGRHPLLLHRDTKLTADAETVSIDLTLPGNTFDISEDYSQELNTVYAQGTSLAGVAYSGMQVSADGQETTYLPMAAARQVDPIRSNPWLNHRKSRKEIMIQMQAGLDEQDAMGVARDHLARFADPGITGTVTLGADPTINGQPVSRFLIRAGMTAVLPGYNGDPNGIVVAITSNSCDLAAGTNALTVDSKFRDALTVQEVRRRGRDALAVNRMLVAGQYTPPISDQILPWDYSTGSGYVPSGPQYNCLPLFSRMPNEMQFPWEEWTKAHPPSDAKWRPCYIHIGPTQANADNNWSHLSNAPKITFTEAFGEIIDDLTVGNPISTRFGIPVKMAQQATIRLTQIAAYDRNGKVLPVDFHVSFYWSHGVNVQSMPKIPGQDKGRYHTYNVGQHYPFVKDAWETYTSSGTTQDPQIPQPVQSAGLVRAYGTYYNRAGYYPGDYASGDAATGLLVDETTWAFDASSDPTWNSFNAADDRKSKYLGRLYTMIYCDAQLDQDVYFLGRLFRVEPGTGSS